MSAANYSPSADCHDSRCPARADRYKTCPWTASIPADVYIMNCMTNFTSLSGLRSHGRAANRVSKYKISVSRLMSGHCA